VEPGGVGRRFCDRTQPGLEAQLCNLADEIAYNAHDIDDGVRSGLISIEHLGEVDLFDRHRREALAEHPGLAGRRVLYETIRRMLSAQVYDVIDATRGALEAAAPADADAVRRSDPLVLFSAAMRTESSALKRFLFRNLYRHPQVVQTAEQAQGVVRALFDAYLAAPAEMPETFARRDDRQRGVADYIAGMTDRFAIREYERLTGQRWVQ
jgi:dGTPase